MVLQNIIELAIRNHIKILFYTSPRYHSYISNQSGKQLQLSPTTINEIVKNNSNCFYYNFLEDTSFNATDFRDADHLNSLGAKKIN